MGDHRADIKIKFSMYGEVKKADMWINWSPHDSECSGIDQRVLDFFREAYNEMYGTYMDQVFEHAQIEQEKQEAEERKEYERLRKKFEGGPHAD